ncbi:hypothetical protein R3X27_05285 [Tropicimonas sp. TH_r6]|uniref:DMP19 family protein n=1 Tax=Tropicimonas sp. TH_r6 TaxID=3082085 RepID=UPI002955AD0F|nr:hypothetical protein [Tropicimonas sp. TH_r6]MDV7142090.1 hypothetical protein [Tropicimonas sp. TH_r6]
MQIFVTQSALKGGIEEYDYDLLDDLTDLRRFLTNRWGLSAELLPMPIRAAASFNSYLGQVLNGGHSQFVSNLGVQAAPVLADATELLRFAGQAYLPRSRRPLAVGSP